MPDLNLVRHHAPDRLARPRPGISFFLVFLRSYPFPVVFYWRNRIPAPAPGFHLQPAVAAALVGVSCQGAADQRRAGGDSGHWCPGQPGLFRYLPAGIFAKRPVHHFRVQSGRSQRIYRSVPEMVDVPCVVCFSCRRLCLVAWGASAQHAPARPDHAVSITGCRIAGAAGVEGGARRNIR